MCFMVFLLRFITCAVERTVIAMAIACIHYGKADAKPFCDQITEENPRIEKELPNPLCVE
jgi:hypothetical protein